jgi:hypothetical protein
MDIFLKKLSRRLQAEAIDGTEVKFEDLRNDQDKVVNIATIALGPQLYARIFPVTDDYKLLNAEVFTHKMRRAKLTHLSQEMLIDALVAFAKEGARPTPVQQLKSKSIEPYTRVKADEDAPTEKELDDLINKIDAELGDRGEESQEVEGDRDEEIKDAIKNIVKTFPKDKEQIEGKKTPEKINVSQQSFEKDSKINWNKGRVEKETDEFGPVRLQENMKNKVFVYIQGIGATWVDKVLYENYKNDITTKWILNDSGEVIRGKKDQESNAFSYVPPILRKK